MFLLSDERGPEITTMERSSLEGFFDVEEDVVYRHDARPYENMTSYERIPLLSVSAAIHGVTIVADLDMTPLRLCARTPIRVRLTFASEEDLQAVLKRVVDGVDGFGMGLYVHMIGITNSSSPGHACGVTASPECNRISRKIVLYSDNESNQVSSSSSVAHTLDLIGLFVADPSSDHYQFILELGTRLFGSGWIEPLPYDASWTREVHDLALLLRVRVNDFPVDVCLGFLHWYRVTPLVP
jgi:hypothetical protein